MAACVGSIKESRYPSLGDALARMRTRPLNVTRPKGRLHDARTNGKQSDYICIKSYSKYGVDT